MERVLLSPGLCAAAMAVGATCLGSRGISCEKVNHMGLREEEGSRSPALSLQEETYERTSQAEFR